MNIGKTLSKIEKLCDKNFSKIPLKERKDSINMHALGNCCAQYYYLIDNDYYNFLKRLHICNALNDLKYERKDEKWNKTTVNAFLHYVFQIAELDKDSDRYKTLSESISKMFNVPINRLNSQANLFLLNLSKNQDNFRIKDYFSTLDIIKYKYRNPERLEKDLKNNKISDEELEVIKEYYGV